MAGARMTAQGSRGSGEVVSDGLEKTKWSMQKGRGKPMIHEVVQAQSGFARNPIARLAQCGLHNPSPAFGPLPASRGEAYNSSIRSPLTFAPRGGEKGAGGRMRGRAGTRRTRRNWYGNDQDNPGSCQLPFD